MASAMNSTGRDELANACKVGEKVRSVFCVLRSANISRTLMAERKQAQKPATWFELFDMMNSAENQAKELTARAWCLSGELNEASAQMWRWMEEATRGVESHVNGEGLGLDDPMDVDAEADASKIMIRAMGEDAAKRTKAAEGMWRSLAYLAAKELELLSWAQALLPEDDETAKLPTPLTEKERELLGWEDDETAEA